jgi:hypothetical protein
MDVVVARHLAATRGRACESTHARRGKWAIASVVRAARAYTFAQDAVAKRTGQFDVAM